MHLWPFASCATIVPSTFHRLVGKKPEDKQRKSPGDAADTAALHQSTKQVTGREFMLTNTRKYPVGTPLCTYDTHDTAAASCNAAKYRGKRIFSHSATVATCGTSVRRQKREHIFAHRNSITEVSRFCYIRMHRTIVRSRRQQL